MNPLVVIGAATVVGVLGASLTRKPSFGPVGDAGIVLSLGGETKHYRLWLDVDPAYTTWWKAHAPSGVTPEAATREDLWERVQKTLHGKVLLVTRDPTSPNVFQVLVRAQGTYRPAPPVRAVRLQQVQAPPEASAPSRVAGTSSPLDPTLTEEEVEAVRQALVTDRNPKHLGGFAVTLEPDFPIAASLLRAKAMLCDYASHGKRAAPAMQKRKEKLLTEARGLFGIEFGEARGGLEALQSATAGLGADAARSWEMFADVLKAAEGFPSRSPLARNHALVADSLRPKTREEAKDLRKAICELVKNAPTEGTKDLFELDPRALERGLRVGYYQAVAARHCVREVAPGVRIVDPQVYRLIDQEAPLDDLRPSPTAAALVQAIQRPETAPVANPGKAVQRAREVVARAKQGDPEARKALEALDRAARSLARRRWVSWYKKNQRRA